MLGLPRFERYFFKALEALLVLLLFSMLGMVFSNVVLRWIGDAFGAAGMASPLPGRIRSICRRRAALSSPVAPIKLPTCRHLSNRESRGLHPRSRLVGQVLR